MFDRIRFYHKDYWQFTDDCAEIFKVLEVSKLWMIGFYIGEIGAYIKGLITGAWR